jgi:hypothetical protein
VDIDNLSDKELATCVEEFVKRAIQHGRNAGYPKSITIQIYASQYEQSSDYTISQMAWVGDYNKEHKSDTNNLIQSVDNAVSRWLSDQIDAPTVVRPMITHEPSIVAQEQEHDDGIPF